LILTAQVLVVSQFLGLTAKSSDHALSQDSSFPPCIFLQRHPYLQLFGEPFPWPMLI